ncbi:hypothetical protein L873DRAFT_1844320 [Choiromyces venosus 120613-1]|uniref:Uncharacterized protein n=1 Tax=Choiromyces venosus 120613-1 TaxID=1336337 RepID=A0A3N4JND4_9PEZI|nr:hypothetical protein L873DRAFT_1844320 [Choiromyces venosus 120613-1]
MPILRVQVPHIPRTFLSRGLPHYGLPPHIRGFNMELLMHTNTVYESKKYNTLDIDADGGTEQHSPKHTMAHGFPAEGSAAARIIALKKVKNKTILLLLKVLLISYQRLDQEFKDLKDEIWALSERTDCGLQRNDCWMIVLIGFFILKGGYDTTSSQGWLLGTKSPIDAP